MIFDLLYSRQSDEEVNAGVLPPLGLSCDSHRAKQIQQNLLDQQQFRVFIKATRLTDLAVIIYIHLYETKIVNIFSANVKIETAAAQYKCFGFTFFPKNDIRLHSQL